MKHTFSNDKRASGTPPTEPRIEKILRDASRLVELGQPDHALAVLNRSNVNTDAIRNARGVCLMRLGRSDDALRLFRALVLSPGSTWMKPDLPTIYCTNFCTALLLAGHPAGCLDGLGEIKDQTHPSIVRLRQTLDRWQKGLSGWAWLMWKVGAEPNVPVTLDFAPGEFDETPSSPPRTPPQEHLPEQVA